MTSAIWIYWFDVVVHALFCRLEQVHLNRRDGIAKVLGTLTSFIGASVITLYKGPTIFSPNPPSNQSDLMFAFGDAKEKNWALGCICCFGHCLCWASWIVLQAVVLKKYPARFSVYSFTCFFSILQFLAIAGYFERDSQAWHVHSVGELFTIFYAVCNTNWYHDLLFQCACCETSWLLWFLKAMIQGIG